MPVQGTDSPAALTDVLFEKAGVGLCLVAPDGTVLRANAEWLRSTGFAAGDVVGEDILDLFPELRDLAAALHARARAGQRVDVPRHAQRVGGRLTWWRGSITPVPMDGGTGLLITAQEVSGEAAGRERAEVLASIAAELNAGADLGAVLRTAVERTVALLRASHGVLLLVEADGHHATLVLERPEGGRVGARVDLDTLPTTTRAFAEGKPVHVVRREAPAATAAWMDRVGFRSGLAIPIAMGGERVAVLFVGYEDEGHLPTDVDLEFAEAVASQAGLAITRARAFEAERSARAHLALSQQLTLALSAAHRPEEVARAVFEQGLAVFGAEAGTLSVPCGEGELELVAQYGFPAEVLEGWQRFPAALRTPVTDAFRSGEAVWVSSRAEAAARYAGTEFEVADSPHGAWVGLPLVVDGRTIGALGLAFPHERPFREEDRRVVLAVSHACAQALDRAQLHAATELDRRRLAAVLDALPTGVALADASGRVTHFNQAILRIWGNPPSPGSIDDYREWRGWWADTGAPVAPTEWAMARALATGEVVPGDLVEIERFDGSGRATIVNAAAPIRDAEGRIVGGVLAEVDITAQRRAEAALREANEALRDADRRKDEFLGMLSHELRNPLAPIRSASYVLRHGEPGSDQARRAQEIIERQTRHLTRLVDDLLDVTRVARGKFDLRRERVDLRELVQRAVDDMRPVIEERGVAFRAALPDGRLWADADATRVTQLVGNLLHNARKFTPRGGEIALSLREVEGRAEIRVRDTGSGIAPQVLPRVFEPFVQGERTLARSEGGLGLGLALVKGIAELHGGDARAVSAGPGAGAELVVHLPLVAAAAAQDAPGARQPRTGGGGRRVLVVDDNVDAADSLADLVELLGHEVEVAYDGPSAVERARASRPDVVLCDIGLPGMNGYDVARTLRATGEPVRLFAVSGYAQPEDVQRAVEAGFDGHVAKPPDLAEIERLLA